MKKFLKYEAKYRLGISTIKLIRSCKLAGIFINSSQFFPLAKGFYRGWFLQQSKVICGKIQVGVV